MAYKRAVLILLVARHGRRRKAGAPHVNSGGEGEYLVHRIAWVFALDRRRYAAAGHKV